LKEFRDCVFDECKQCESNVDYFNNMERIIVLLCEKEEGKQGRWFVGGNGEYDVIVGFEFSGDNDNKITYYEEEM